MKDGGGACSIRANRRRARPDRHRYERPGEARASCVLPCVGGRGYFFFLADLAGLAAFADFLAAICYSYHFRSELPILNC